MAEPGTTVRSTTEDAHDPLTIADRPTLIVVAAASAAAVVGAWFPAPDAPPVGQAGAQQVRDWTVENAAALRLSAAAILIVALAFLTIAAGLVALARRHLGHPLVADLLLANAVVVAVLLTLDIGASAVTLLLPDLVGTTVDAVSEAVVVSWLAIGGYTHLLGDLQIAFVAAALACGTVTALRLRLVNKWLGYGGFLVAACGALGAAGIITNAGALYPLWFVGTIGLYVALLVLGIACARAARRVRAR